MRERRGEEVDLGGPKREESVARSTFGERVNPKQSHPFILT